MAKRQSRDDQLKRIEKGLCPVHGTCLTQVPARFNCADFSLAECTRGDCHIRMFVDHVYEDGTIDMRIRHLITPEQTRRLEWMWEDLYGAVEDARERFAAELEAIAHSPEVQLPIDG